VNRVEAALAEAADAFQGSVDQDETLRREIGALIAAGKTPNMFRVLRWPDGSDPVVFTMQLTPTPK
jgi:hypothetical protein